MSEVALQPPAGATGATADERKAALARGVAKEVHRGWHVQSQTDFQAVLAKGKRTSHGVHIFLSIITLLLWVPIWVLMVVVNRDQHRVLDVDTFANLTVQK